jgi:hypothetical protein
MHGAGTCGRPALNGFVMARSAVAGCTHHEPAQGRRLSAVDLAMADAGFEFVYAGFGGHTVLSCLSSAYRGSD